MTAAIVDDLDSERETLRGLLEQYVQAHALPLVVEEYAGGQAFLDDYAPGRFDVVFLDIFMDEKNGIETAAALRLLDERVNIVFLTTSTDFGLKSYDVRAADYIVKPASTENLERALHYCRIDETPEIRTLTLAGRREPLCLELDSILYADFRDRAACVHLAGEVLPVAGSFGELSKKLAAYPEFMLCFKGIVVNLNKVREIGSDTLTLKNGERLPVSRRLQKQVRQQRLSLLASSLRGEK